MLSIMVHLKKEVVMKSIEIDDDLYAFIASQTKHIGESASQILRRLLLPEDGAISHGISARADNNEIKNTSAEGATEEFAVEASVNAATQAPVKRQSVSGAKKAPAKSTGTTSPVKAAAKKSTAKAASTAKTAPDTASTTSAFVAESETHSKRDILDAVTKDALATFTKRVDQFLFVLSAAHKLNADNFSSVESIKGKNRTYFATSKEALLENGSSTNPKAIPDSAFWVVTNNNTAKKTNMLEQVLRILGYQPDVVESVIARFTSEGK